MSRTQPLNPRKLDGEVTDPFESRSSDGGLDEGDSERTPARTSVLASVEAVSAEKLRSLEVEKQLHDTKEKLYEIDSERQSLMLAATIREHELQQATAQVSELTLATARAMAENERLENVLNIEREATASFYAKRIGDHVVQLHNAKQVNDSLTTSLANERSRADLAETQRDQAVMELKKAKAQLEAVEGVRQDVARSPGSAVKSQGVPEDLLEVGDNPTFVERAMKRSGSFQNLDLDLQDSHSPRDRHQEEHNHIRTTLLAALESRQLQNNMFGLAPMTSPTPKRQPLQLAHSRRKDMTYTYLVEKLRSTEDALAQAEQDVVSAREQAEFWKEHAESKPMRCSESRECHQPGCSSGRLNDWRWNVSDATAVADAAATDMRLEHKHIPARVQCPLETLVLEFQAAFKPMGSAEAAPRPHLADTLVLDETLQNKDGLVVQMDVLRGPAVDQDTAWPNVDSSEGDAGSGESGAPHPSHHQDVPITST